MVYMHISGLVHRTHNAKYRFPNSTIFQLAFPNMLPHLLLGRGAPLNSYMACLFNRHLLAISLISSASAQRIIYSTEKPHKRY